MHGLIARLRVRRGLEVGPGLLDGRLPCAVAARDRPAQREAFQLDARLRHVPEIGERERAHAEAALILGEHEAVGDEAEQCLAHRRDADVEALAQRADQQLLARRTAAAQDIGPHAGIDGGYERARAAGLAAALGTKIDRDRVGVVHRRRPDMIGHCHGGGRQRQSKNDFRNS